MTSMTRLRVCSLTLGLWFRTRETVPTLTPAVAATSAMFTRWADFSRLTFPGFAARAATPVWNRFHLEVLLGPARSQATGLTHLGHIMTSVTSSSQLRAVNLALTWPRLTLRRTWLRAGSGKRYSFRTWPGMSDTPCPVEIV